MCTFYARHPGAGLFPPRGVWNRDFGPSELGRHPADAGYTGRRLDLQGRCMPVDPDADPVAAVRAYLRAGRGMSPWLWAQKAVIAIDPPPLRGAVVWPVR